MNENQHRGYWRRFAAACREHCRQQGLEQISSADREALRKRWTAEAGLDPSLSHWDYNWRQTQVIFRQFEHLARPADLDAAMRTDQDPTRDGYLRKIGQHAPQYVGEIVWRVSHKTTRDPAELRTEQLRNLVIVLEEQDRKAKRERRSSQLTQQRIPF